MPLQDLTPQLRTRLSRVERAVGVFVILATALLFSGFAYYVYHLAERKGWFLNKVAYFTLLNNATGLKVGDPVKLMGFDAGEITDIDTMPPGSYYGIFVQIRVKEPYYGYLWKDSKVKVAPADFLGKRFMELTRGTTGLATVLVKTNHVFLGRTKRVPIGILVDRTDTYHAITNGFKGYYLPPDESPALTEKLDEIVKAVEAALPKLTNHVFNILANSTVLTSNLNSLVLSAQPIATNVVAITDRLREPKGSLGEWLIPTNLNLQLQNTLATANTALTNANSTLSSAQTNLNVLAANLNLSLLHLAELTGNLNSQVQANSLILTEISSLIVDVDDLVQGLKRHWLLKSSFKDATNSPIRSLVNPTVGGER